MKLELLLIAALLIVPLAFALPTTVTNVGLNLSAGDVQYLRGKGFTSLQVSGLECTNDFCRGEVALKKGRVFIYREQIAFPIYAEITSLELGTARSDAVREWIVQKVIYLKQVDTHLANQNGATQGYSNSTQTIQ